MSANTGDIFTILLKSDINLLISLRNNCVRACFPSEYYVIKVSCVFSTRSWMDFYDAILSTKIPVTMY